MFTEELKSTRHRVRYILENYEETKDSDKLLWIEYMRVFLGLETVIEMGCFNNFKKFIMAGDTPLFETLRRSRQKLQEMDDTLRGESYHDRQYEQVEVRKYLKEL